MAKITALTADATVLDTDLCVTVEDPSGTPVTKKATWATIGVLFAARSETLTNKTISGASNTISNLAASAIASGTLVHERGGLEADVSAYSGWVKISGGATSAVAVASAVETWAVTPSGANLASALTSALPDTKGGTGLTALGAGVATWLGTPSGANLGSALTSALTAAKGGTGIDTSGTTGVPKIAAGTWSSFALGTGVETFLTTPSGANLASALTTALPDTKGGTGLTALGAGVATFLGTPSGANLASALTSALSVSKGGTGVTALTSFTSDITTTGVLTGGGFVNTSTSTSSSTGTINNFSLTAGVNFVRLTGAAPVITGITGGTHGRRVVFEASGGNAVFNNEDAGSTAANRIDTPLNTVTCYQGACLEFFYSGTTGRWVVMSGVAAPET